MATYVKINSVENSGPTQRMRLMVGNKYKLFEKYPDGSAKIKGFLFSYKDIEFIEIESKIKFNPENLLDI